VRLVELAAQAGFDHFRMMIEKERETFTRGRVVATIDKLPRDIGEFLELEAHSAAELEVVMAELALPKAPEKLDYGDIIMAYNGSNDTRGRTAVFDVATRDAIYALVKEHAV
jgi:adenylate cyclase class IV